MPYGSLTDLKKIALQQFFVKKSFWRSSTVLYLCVRPTPPFFFFLPSGAWRECGSYMRHACGHVPEAQTAAQRCLASENSLSAFAYHSFSFLIAVLLLSISGGDAQLTHWHPLSHLCHVQWYQIWQFQRPHTHFSSYGQSTHNSCTKFFIELSLSCGFPAPRSSNHAVLLDSR